MCLYPKKFINKKYTATKKNEVVLPLADGYGVTNIIPKLTDERVGEIQIPCGNCIECRKQKANEWRVRLIEELKVCKYPYFITLTFSPEELYKLCIDEAISENKCNAIAKIAMRRSLERWRKDNKKSIKHWFITERGHEGTERIHMHGIYLSDKPLEFEKIERQKDGWNCKWKYWKYGTVFVGDYCTIKTINYMVKYVTKIDEVHKDFKQIILCSPGIGKAFTEKYYFRTYKYRPKQSKDYYTLNNGAKTALPRYYKNKAYSEEEREKIWIEKMNREKIAIMGNEYSTNNIKLVNSVTYKAREVNQELGYGNDSPEWKGKDYNITAEMIQSQRLLWLHKKFADMRKNQKKAIKDLKKGLNVK